MAARVLLIDDHKILRDGLCSLLTQQPDMEVVGQAGDGIMAIRLAGELEPDIIVMDVNMTGIDGIDATRRIKKQSGNIKIIALSMYSKKTFVTEMLKAGASGYILKEHAFTELVKAIETVLSGEVYLSSKAANVLVEDYIESRESSQKVLTERERKILKLLAEGKPSKEVALLIDKSVKTVDADRRRIMQKLNISSFAELMKFAIREGITSLDT